MRCLECGSEAVTERAERTAQGYRRFRCRACGKPLNERSGTLLNRTQYPSDVIALVVLWRSRHRGGRGGGFDGRVDGAITRLFAAGPAYGGRRSPIVQL
jgi:hypothetical protein